MSSGRRASFYHTKEWKRTRAAFLACRNYVCEICGKPASIAHHKVHLTDGNVSDPTVSLSFDNLQALCTDCHAREHGLGSTAQGLVFDSNGNLVAT